ncbi:MAG: hypothetical protein PHN89_04840 [Candidatus Pacebacteria bacterium]|nr:hypothetical protein [Candidatus Paceibacterota bacterium]
MKRKKVNVSRDDFVKMAFALGFQPHPMLDIKNHIPFQIPFTASLPPKPKKTKK